MRRCSRPIHQFSRSLTKSQRRIGAAV